MDEKPEEPPAPQHDLAAALRRARMENAERAQAIADLREIEAGRLALLESALKPVVRQAPAGVDMFDVTLTQGDHPRLFLDMVAFVDMGRDRRTYRFFQDTLHGRVLIAESPALEKIVAAVTNYVARRLVERERALAAERPAAEALDGPHGLDAGAGEIPREAPRPTATLTGKPKLVAPEAPPPVRRTLGQHVSAAFSALVMTLGWTTLIALVVVGGYLAWTLRLRDVWAHFIGRPPF